MKLSLVVPCYNEEENVKSFYDCCTKVLDENIADYEIIFVNDGSRDNTWKELLKIKEYGANNLKLVNFSRNFGKESAMYAGLKKAEGEYVTIIDADLQQRPELALKMIDFLEKNEEFDSVATYQANRNEGSVLSFLKKSFYKIINKICDIEFYQGASDFRTFRRSMVDAILQMTEYHRFSKGIFSWVGFNSHYMEYTAEQRAAGSSSWSFKKLFNYAIEGIVAFTVFPLKLATTVGCVFSFLSLAYIVAVLIEKLAFGIDIPGYATLVILVLLIGGIQLISLGILGEYISRIYIQGKNRPIFIVKDYINTAELEKEYEFKN